MCVTDDNSYAKGYLLKEDGDGCFVLDQHA